MPVKKMLNALKILFTALSAMFLFLYLSLMQRQANMIVEAATRKVRDTDSLFNSVPLTPAMALIPMIVCIIFTIFLFVVGEEEKKKELKQNDTPAPETVEENNNVNIIDTITNINDNVEQALNRNTVDRTEKTAEENIKED